MTVKVILITTPIRPSPTNFPPIGSLSIISYLNRNGVDDVEFYHIDANRPNFDDAVAHIVAAKPNVLGISSVVSTAYEYTKKISLAVKSALPGTLIVLGGNLAASAEVILNRTGVDLCVLGEGERVFLDIVRRAETTLNPRDFADIAGLAMLDDAGNLMNTGFVAALDRTEIYDIDWSILERATDIGIYFREVAPGTDGMDKFKHDPRARQPHRIGKRYALIPAAKGCVARCTFCHRWDKGIRYIPPDLFIDRLKAMIERFGIGFISVADENFGTDRKWLKEFCEKIKPLDILWRVGGMRVNSVTPEQLAMMKDAGCSAILFGMETGSPRMLEVMEKKTKQADNENAMRWTIDAGLHTIVQLVLGMPGETPETVGETTEFAKWANSLSPIQSPNDLSVNFAQALPGTPLYEFARHKGLIASGIDGEEAYLLRISDKDAHDDVTTLNFTDFPSLVCAAWRTRMMIEVNYAYLKKFGVEHYMKKTLGHRELFELPREDEGYFANPKRLVDTSLATSTVNEQAEMVRLGADGRPPSLLWLVSRKKFGLVLICYPRLAYRFRHFMIFLTVLNNLQRNGVVYTLDLLGEYLLYNLKRLVPNSGVASRYRSLRKIVDQELGVLPTDSAAMAPLRRGR